MASGRALSQALAQQIVEACHAKTRPGPMGQLREAPIGRGGKKDDTSCVVAEVVEWTKDWDPHIIYIYIYIYI